VPFIEKQLKIQDEMTEKEVDEILAGFTSLVEPLEGEHKLAADMFKKKSAFVKIYDRRLPGSERHFLIQVYFDEEHRVVGRTCSGKE